jgi:D-sedoheptulose 7-phosphate isomerase
MAPSLEGLWNCFSAPWEVHVGDVGMKVQLPFVNKSMIAKTELDLVLDHFEEHKNVVAKSLRQLRGPIRTTAGVLVEALTRGHKLLAFGNGGSAAQASHLVAELVGRFLETRRPFPAIALVTDPGVVTCIANDFGYDSLFQRQVEALVQTGDVVVGFTTSGRSENVIRGLRTAGQKGAIAIALTGGRNLEFDCADHVVRVPSLLTARIQEVHLMILHVWCSYVDAALGKSKRRERKEE